ncbi:hypothetical protein Daura_31365 [Dactylosporangium aurantiacum]|uniref:GH26 domain-containing protein n=2 Tax=Dactylosporangium aurantiacum TaxID=35754 RepID=A0A9Q9IA67_9ACTN|nr:hypothetical protein [Dactylosporangium aurantiacum]MDG6107220.1 hypothetical protein [Dactylosporangium aurantiacum]UWZ51246.1 hypothetical protein Daura_31365 [Dactylosporangium aurantiacum]
MRSLARRTVLLLVLALGLVGLDAGVAHAASAGTVSPATVHGSEFTFTCDINPGGATVYVAGRSWNVPVITPTAVDTTRTAISGTATQRLTFTRDGAPNTTYGYRCVWFSSPTSTTLAGKTTNSLEVTTGADTVLGANVDGSSRVACTPGTGGCTCDAQNVCTRAETFDEALARQDAAYAPGMLRLFYSGLPSTSCANDRNAQTRPVLISWKAAPADVSAGTYDATLNAWLSCFTKPTRVSYYHEPEDNFTTAGAQTAYRAAWDAFIDLVQAHPNHANLIPTLILSDWSLAAGSGRDWTGWYNPRVSELWWDVYGFNETDTNATNDQLMAAHQAQRPSLAASRGVGKPYGIGELGYNKASNRPAFLADAAAWARANDIVGMLYFDSIGTLGDHRLRDTASQAAWRTAIAG